MKISTKYRYGTRAMLELALYYGKRAVSVRKIAERHEISKKYLERLFSLLSEAGLVISQRGKKGGFFLSRPPEQITVHDIAVAVDGPVELASCIGGDGTCTKIATCVTRDVWSSVQEKITGELEAITLADLVSRHKQKIDKLNENIYFI